ncbi:MAG: IS110 family transposase [Chloroflexi bacterium]|nr:IS110 family transposase [Chloroflexota bacterium]
MDNSAYWKEEFERLADRIGKLKAIVAIARKMLVVVWHVLTKKEADRHAQPEKVASKFLHWAYDLRREGRQGIRAGEFAGCKLKEIRMKETVYSVRRSGRTVRLGPEDE